jgi:hypothetical protein
MIETTFQLYMYFSNHSFTLKDISHLLTNLEVWIILNLTASVRLCIFIFLKQTFTKSDSNSVMIIHNFRTFIFSWFCLLKETWWNMLIWCSGFLFEIEIRTVIEDMIDLKYVEYDFSYSVIRTKRVISSWHFSKNFFLLLDFQRAKKLA